MLSNRTLQFFNYSLTHVYLSTEPDAKEILNAAENGQLDRMQRSLARNPRLLECTDKDGYTPLHRACYGNHVKIVEVRILYLK